jgi:aspartate/tyrosine/aromatic aminotransferase
MNSPRSATLTPCVQHAHHARAGVDPSHAQWEAVAEVMAARKLLPWFDFAYQGFASGDPEADAWAVRMFAAKVGKTRVYMVACTCAFPPV